MKKEAVKETEIQAAVYGVRHTQVETAAHLGISKQRVQMLEKSALAKMRRALEELGIKGVRDALP